MIKVYKVEGSCEQYATTKRDADLQKDIYPSNSMLEKEEEQKDEEIE